MDLSHAATITVKPLGSGMPPAVIVSGTFVDGDEGRFRSMTASLPQAIVTFASPGGFCAGGYARRHRDQGKRVYHLCCGRTDLRIQLRHSVACGD